MSMAAASNPAPLTSVLNPLRTFREKDIYLGGSGEALEKPSGEDLHRRRAFLLNMETLTGVRHPGARQPAAGGGGKCTFHQFALQSPQLVLSRTVCMHGKHQLTINLRDFWVGKHYFCPGRPRTWMIQTGFLGGVSKWNPCSSSRRDLWCLKSGQRL